jgi:hypothetical protein
MKIAEPTPQRKRELRESLVKAFIACGHSPEEARIAARGPEGDELLDAFAIAEATDDPIGQMGARSREFLDGQGVLEKAGFAFESKVESSPTGVFKKGASRIFLTQDGTWSYDNTGLSGRNAYSLQLFLMSL